MSTYKNVNLNQNNCMLKENEKSRLLGQNIARERKCRNLSQNELAEMVNISREHLAKIETAKRGISLKLLFKICSALEIEENVVLDFYSES